MAWSIHWAQTILHSPYSPNYALSFLVFCHFSSPLKLCKWPERLPAEGGGRGCRRTDTLWSSGFKERMSILEAGCQCPHAMGATHGWPIYDSPVHMASWLKRQTDRQTDGWSVWLCHCDTRMAPHKQHRARPQVSQMPAYCNKDGEVCSKMAKLPFGKCDTHNYQMIDSTKLKRLLLCKQY